MIIVAGLGVFSVFFILCKFIEKIIITSVNRELFDRSLMYED